MACENKIIIKGRPVSFTSPPVFDAHLNNKTNSRQISQQIGLRTSRNLTVVDGGTTGKRISSQSEVMGRAPADGLSMNRSSHTSFINQTQRRVYSQPPVSNVNQNSTDDEFAAFGATFSRQVTRKNKENDVLETNSYYLNSNVDNNNAVQRNNNNSNYKEQLLCRNVANYCTCCHPSYSACDCVGMCALCSPKIEIPTIVTNYDLKPEKLVETSRKKTVMIDYSPKNDANHCGVQTTVNKRGASTITNHFKLLQFSSEYAFKETPETLPNKSIFKSTEVQAVQQVKHMGCSTEAANKRSLGISDDSINVICKPKVQSVNFSHANLLTRSNHRITNTEDFQIYSSKATNTDEYPKTTNSTMTINDEPFVPPIKIEAPKVSDWNVFNSLNVVENKPIVPTKVENEYVLTESSFLGANTTDSVCESEDESSQVTVEKKKEIITNATLSSSITEQLLVPTNSYIQTNIVHSPFLLSPQIHKKKNARHLSDSSTIISEKGEVFNFPLNNIDCDEWRKSTWHAQNGNDYHIESDKHIHNNHVDSVKTFSLPVNLVYSDNTDRARSNFNKQSSLNSSLDESVFNTTHAAAYLSSGSANRKLRQQQSASIRSEENTEIYEKCITRRLYGLSSPSTFGNVDQDQRLSRTEIRREKQSLELPTEVEDACAALAKHFRSPTSFSSVEVEQFKVTVFSHLFYLASNPTTTAALMRAFIISLRGYHENLLQMALSMVDQNGNTCCHYIAGESNWDVIHEIIKTGYVDVDYTNNLGYTTVMITSMGHVLPIYRTHADIVKQIYARSRNLNIICKTTGHTALMLAAVNGRLEMVQALLRYTVNPNIVDHSRKSALMLAAEKGHADVVRSLLTCELIDVSLTDCDGNTAQMLAQQNNWNNVAQLIEDKSSKLKRLRTRAQSEERSNRPQYSTTRVTSNLIQNNFHATKLQQ